MDYRKAADNIRGALKTYIEEHKRQSLVIGISGGIDSALCAALAMPVCREIGIPLIGRSIPIKTNTKDEVKRSRLVGKTFCDFFTEDMLDQAYKDFVGGWPITLIKDKIRQGNIKARLRMIRLYDSAAAYKGMVLSTDNYTEYLLGFWTLHGDVGDYGMIQSLWKSEVYDLTDHLINTGGMTSKYADALRACSEAVATDGLGITSNDLEQIHPGWTGSSREGYNEVDEILKDYRLTEYYMKTRGEMSGQGDKLRKLEEHPVVKRYLATKFKRNNPYNIPREEIEK